ncbi:FAD-dependent oxidoreductase [Botrimarina sp.]|uniref:NAD(P)/FAD-dependent oxidoreductase n=1 Tax=Botrimarina sp. TaxID=2795802 RepID=UPI0032EC6446
MPGARTSDAIVIGGGAIGLSVAYELATRGLSVTLLERGEIGREASWAGAGVLPPASWYVDHPALDRLAMTAAPMHAELSQRLRETTGVDDQYAACGAVYQLTESNEAHVLGVLSRWRELGVAVGSGGADGRRVPQEAQVRNPRRLKALAAGCRMLGVHLAPGAEVTGFRRAGPRVAEVVTAAGPYAADAVVLAAGCWSPALGEQLRVAAPGRPVRGQMLLLAPRGEPIDGIVHRHPFYAVARRDGLVLVGATVEEAGFDKSTTEEGVAALRRAAGQIAPALADARVEAVWAGLRPASADALPQIGPAPGIDNVWIASGHHRSGLQLSPPTAAIIAALVLGESPPAAHAEFAPARFAARGAAPVRAAS